MPKINITTKQVQEAAEYLHATEGFVSDRRIGELLGVGSAAVLYHRRKLRDFGAWKYRTHQTPQSEEAHAEWVESRKSAAHRAKDAETRRLILEAGHAMKARGEAVGDTKIARATGLTASVVRHFRMGCIRKGNWPFEVHNNTTPERIQEAISPDLDERLEAMARAEAIRREAFEAMSSHAPDTRPEVAGPLSFITAREREMLRCWNAIARERDQARTLKRRKVA